MDWQDDRLSTRLRFDADQTEVLYAIYLRLMLLKMLFV